MLRIGIPDIISPSYFPAIAAVDLGYLAAEGFEGSASLVTPVDRTMNELRDGNLDFAVGCAHSVPYAFPAWNGAKVVAAISHNTYWFLVVRADLDVTPDHLSGLSGLRIGAAPLVDLSLMRILRAAGVDGVEIGPVPGAFLGSDLNFGVAAAKALKAGLIDGFWANGMGAEIAIRSGAGKLALDARRGDGPAGTSSQTFSALVATDAMIAERPDEVRAMVRALRRAQTELRKNPELAVEVGAKRYPEYETSLIAGLIAHDAPFYDASVTPDMVETLVQFQIDMGLLDTPVGYESVAANLEEQK